MHFLAYILILLFICTYQNVLVILLIYRENKKYVYVGIFVYRYVVPKPRSECTKGEQLIVTFAAGYIAGVFCAIVSHPADTVVSKLNQAKGSTAMGVAKKLGFAGKFMYLVRYTDL